MWRARAKSAPSPDPVKLLNGATGSGVGKELIRALVENLYSGTLDQLDLRRENSNYGTYGNTNEEQKRFCREEVICTAMSGSLMLRF